MMSHSVEIRNRTLTIQLQPPHNAIATAQHVIVRVQHAIVTVHI